MDDLQSDSMNKKGSKCSAERRDKSEWPVSDLPGSGTSNDLVSHLKQHDGKGYYKCGLCGLRLENTSTLVSHAALHTKQNPDQNFVCIYVPEALGNIPINPTVKTNAYKSKTCDNAAKCPKSRQKQQFVHSKVFKCKKCDFTAKCSESLKEHTCKVHKRKQVYKCKECNFTAKSYVTLKNHQHEHTKVYACKRCDFTAECPKRLKEHEFTHTDGTRTKEQTFLCDICGQGFTQFRAFESHTMKHTNEKPYKCNLCEHASRTADLLTKHIQMHHGGERPYKCDLCSFSTAWPGGLSAHKSRVHYGIKPYSCNLCDRRFSQTAHLRKHKLTHTGEKNYPCDLCSYRASLPQLLKLHKMRHAGDKPHR